MIETTGPAEEPGLRHEAIERRSWILAAVLIGGSLLLRSREVTVGLLVGSGLAVLNYRWLCNFVSSVTSGGRRPSKGALFVYSLKYLLTGVAIFITIKYDFADAVALLAGVSVIFLAICWEGIRLHRTVKEGADHAEDV